MPIDDLPLQGVRVLDRASGPLAAIGRLLGELGADVVRIEPRHGSADREQAVTAAGPGVDFVAGNLGKRVIAVDLKNPADNAVFESLLPAADILIQSGVSDSADVFPLDVAGIRARFPALVILSASAFGSRGPLRDWQATDPVFQALSGNLARSGTPGRMPLLPPGEMAVQTACAQAVFVILVAFIQRLKTGRGDHLDFSVLDGACHTFDPGYGMAGSAWAGVPPERMPRGRPAVGHMYPIIACADGFVRLCVLAPRQWRAMFEWLGSPEEFADPVFNTLKGRFSSTTLIPCIAKLFADKSRAMIEAEGQRRGIPVASVLELSELLQSAQIQQRQVLADIDLGGGASAPFMNGSIEIDRQRAGPRRGVPRVDAERAAILADWSPARRNPWRWDKAGPRPLSGVSVLDLGVIVVGAEQSRLLGDQGADVIKVENAAFPDGSRQTSVSSTVSVTFAAGHRNKRGLGLNLRDPEGKALFLKLVAQSDVIAANFKPGTLESLGLGYDTLSTINPGLIMLNSSAFGATGPWSGRLGYGPLVRATAGLTSQWRYPDDLTSFSDAITIYPDHVAGRVGAIGVLALLIRRARTGRGGTVDVAQLDVMLSHMAPQIAAIALSGTAVAGGEPAQDAPWGVFPAQGDDEWCVVTVRNDADWHQFCEVVGREDLRRDPALASARGRAAQRPTIDQAVTDWLARRSPREAMAALQAAGVPAAAMLRVGELPHFPHFVERQFFRRVSHPKIAEPFYVETAPVRSENLPDPPEGPAPLAGEHTIEIAKLVFNLSDAEIDRLIRAKVLEVSDDGAGRI